MVNYQELLSNLLAVIHADGGHYEAEHGTVKAVTDAIEKVFEMKAHLTQRAPDELACDDIYHDFLLQWEEVKYCDVCGTPIRR